MTDNRKYLVAIVGLIIGFAVSFFFTRSYNKQKAAAEPAAATQPAASMGGQGSGPEPMQIVAKARSNPSDFNAQLEAAAQFGELSRQTNNPQFIQGEAEFLEKAYAADSNKFMGLKGETGVTAAHYLGELYFDQNKFDDAERWFKRAYESNPKDTESLGHLVEIHLAKKDAKSAEDALNRLKQADPGNKDIASLEGKVSDLKAGKPVPIPTH